MTEAEAEPVHLRGTPGIMHQEHARDRAETPLMADTLQAEELDPEKTK